MPASSQGGKVRESNLRLGTSILSIGGLQICSWVALRDKIGIASHEIDISLHWAAIVTLISTLYYILYLIFRKCTKQSQINNETFYRNLPTQSNAETTERYNDDQSSTDSQLRTSRHSETTLLGFLIYSYGWGLVLFVGLYCVSGVYIPGANWWSLGFLLLSIDELFVIQAGKSWICLISVFLAISTSAVWWGVLGEGHVDQGIAEIFMGVVAPALAPNILFTLRFYPRNLFFKSYGELIKTTLPFMVILSICVIVIQSVHSDSEIGKYRRQIRNESLSNEFYQTHAPFHNKTQSQKFSYSGLIIDKATEAVGDYNTPEKIIAFFVAPLFALAILYEAVFSVLVNCATEFVVALTYCTAIRFGLSREYDWVSMLALSSVSLSFVLVILLRRTK